MKLLAIACVATLFGLLGALGCLVEQKPVEACRQDIVTPADLYVWQKRAAAQKAREFGRSTDELLWMPADSTGADSYDIVYHTNKFPGAELCRLNGTKNTLTIPRGSPVVVRDERDRAWGARVDSLLALHSEALLRAAQRTALITAALVPPDSVRWIGPMPVIWEVRGRTQYAHRYATDVDLGLRSDGVVVWRAR